MQSTLNVTENFLSNDENTRKQTIRDLLDQFLRNELNRLQVDDEP